MFKLQKLADYGVVLMIELGSALGAQSAVQLAKVSAIPLPTVRKLLKLLQTGGLISSQQGPRGGYQLARAPRQIRLSDMLSAISGDLTFTDCQHDVSDCGIRLTCNVRGHWQRLNGLFLMILQQISLEDLLVQTMHLVNGRSPGEDWKLSLNFMQELQNIGYVAKEQVPDTLH